MDFELKGKFAMVTGGSRGIGRAISLMLADHGANVVICGRTQESLDQTVADIKAKGVNAWGFQTDVSKVDQITKFVSDAADAAGTVPSLSKMASM